MTPVERKLILKALLALLDAAKEQVKRPPDRKGPETARDYVNRMAKVQDIGMRRSA